MDERSIQMMAHHLINHFGEKALGHVNDCIEQAAEQEDESAVLMWNRIFNVIDEWQRDTERRSH